IAYVCSSDRYVAPRDLLSFPTRRSSDLHAREHRAEELGPERRAVAAAGRRDGGGGRGDGDGGRPGLLLRRPLRGRLLLRRRLLRSEEHTSELQSRENLVCRLLLEKKKRS